MPEQKTRRMINGISCFAVFSRRDKGGKYYKGSIAFTYHTANPVTLTDADAVAVTGDNFSQMFAQMDDDYMNARAADVKDISERLIHNLMGTENLDFASMEPSVIVADDLTPSETVQMDKEKILAFVTVHGSSNSHTFILARMMNIPALIGVPVNLEEVRSGIWRMILLLL